jgi:hypothetical protein
MITLEGVCLGVILALAMVTAAVLMWYEYLTRKAPPIQRRRDESGEFSSADINSDKLVGD